MKIRGLTLIVLALAIGVGCWSIDSKAGPSPSVSDAHEVNSKPTPTATPKMTERDNKSIFLGNLPDGFEQPQDDAGGLLLREYGAVFLARNGAVPPKKVFFTDEADVAAFQSTLERSSAEIGAYKIELQAPAMAALKGAIAEARKAGLSISPRGADSARRGYTQTVKLWASRVNPGMTYWVGKGRVSAADAGRIQAMTPFQQIPEVLALEQKGIFFAKDLSKSIIYSVAPPGSSQHLSMLALDVAEFDNGRVRSILASHGWFQTVASDLPHFTYLGVTEDELPGFGLKKVTISARTFWVPDI